MEKEYDIKTAAQKMDVIFKNSSNQDFGNFITILNKLLGNIIRRPNEDKFRSVNNTICKLMKLFQRKTLILKIRKENKKLQQKLFISPVVFEMFQALGYVDDGENLLFPLGESVLQEFTVVVEGYQSLLQARVNNQNANPAHRKNEELEALMGELMWEG